MLSLETRWALVGCVILTVAFFGDDSRVHSWWSGAIMAIASFFGTRAVSIFVHAVNFKDLSAARSTIIQSPFARSLDATLRDTFVAPVIDVAITNGGMARARFFSSGMRGRTWSTWMHLRLKSPALDRAPWLHLQGARRFWLPTVAVGAKALTTPTPDRHWRYWRLPWQSANPTVESADFCAVLPATHHNLVLTSRPGHLLIRAKFDCHHDADVVFENAVRLAIAWVKAVQQTAGCGSPAAERAPGA